MKELFLGDDMQERTVKSGPPLYMGHTLYQGSYADTPRIFPRLVLSSVLEETGR